jgi:hypothetical protein
VRLRMLWASQRPGHYLTIRNFAEVLFNFVWFLLSLAGVLFNVVGVLFNRAGDLFSGVLFNFARVPISCFSSARLHLLGVPQGGGLFASSGPSWCVLVCFGRPKGRDTISPPRTSWEFYLTSCGSNQTSQGSSLLSWGSY